MKIKIPQSPNELITFDFAGHEIAVGRMDDWDENEDVVMTSQCWLWLINEVRDNCHVVEFTVDSGTLEIDIPDQQIADGIQSVYDRIHDEATADLPKKRKRAKQEMISVTDEFKKAIKDYQTDNDIASWSAALIKLAAVGYEKETGKQAPTPQKQWGGKRK